MQNTYFSFQINSI